MTFKGREVAECVGWVGEFAVGDEGDADPGGGDGGDVGLAVVGPVDLDEVGPGGDVVVLAEADAAGVGGGLFEVGPLGDAGLVAVGTDEVAGAKGAAIGVNQVVFAALDDALNDGLPVEADSKGGGAVEQELVESGATDAAAGAGWEGSFGGGVGVRIVEIGGGGAADEADAAEESGFGLAEVVVEVEAEGGQGGERVGHEAFAARLVDTGLHGVDEFDLKALTGGSDGAGQTGWTCAYYEDICWVAVLC
jgi:hypothetical protein